ncbi:8-amino-7-oxononanoate synthase [Pseudaeromonas paramecii]|uniref:8-amino-7-oxononanoate synthase n=1 Tax=Pseudaeromonas paramecii TaxID=2138166 RepID=A0ABP8Q7B9_9GAMM
MPFDLSSVLAAREAAGLKRQRICLDSGQGREIWVEGQAYLNFSGNDYLGAASQPEILQAWRAGLERWGAGSGASPLVTGYSQPHARLEAQLCDWLGVEAALLFSTGFAANQAVLKALLGKEHLQWQDRLNHASLQEAGAASPAPMKRFAHNDMAHLARLLAPKRGLIISEGVFSMDGDQAPLSELVALSQASGNWLMIDDAHGLGVLGAAGRGTLAAQGMRANQVQILMGTFGKALGCAGAFVAGSRELVDYLANFAREYVYSTHLPPAQAEAISAAIAWVQQADGAREQLQAHIALFRQGAAQLGLRLGDSQTAIQPLLVGESEAALILAQRLRQRGVWVTAIRPPTVPAGQARLRLTLTAAHRPEDIARLLSALAEATA